VTKADVISEIAAKTGIEKADVSATIEKFFEVVKGSMANGDNIYVRGFGSFVNKKRAQKVARKVIRKGEKGEPMIIPAHFVPSFKPAKEFVNMIKTSKKIK
jgi:DNA-binding protein HU-beta